MQTKQAPNGTHYFMIFDNMVLVLRGSEILLTLAPEDFEIVWFAEIQAQAVRERAFEIVYYTNGDELVTRIVEAASLEAAIAALVDHPQQPLGQMKSFNVLDDAL